MQPFKLPVHLVIENPKKVGRKGRELFAACLLGLVISSLTGGKLDRSTFLILGGGVLAGLAMWHWKEVYYRGQKIDVLLENDFISFSHNLLKHPHLWPQFKNGSHYRIPWQEISRWDFSDPDNHSRGGGWFPTEYSLRIRSTPGTFLIIDREPLIKVEAQFIPIAQHILRSLGHELHGLND